MARRTLSARYRWGVASRVAAASVGVYVLTSLFAVATALVLRGMGSVSRADAVLIATLASLLVYCASVMAVFQARSATRAWAGLALACAPPAITIVALLGTGHTG